ncbi:hypothetical protein VCR31J2_1360083 [Vibrio coralliirubri]|uniref:Uncharacterized protein n=1 Tax=Vibrio coralliirubri TaxID=1516159 RepID=A0AA86XNF1_9VIBR|nr:hypothetical protein VCR31J2_1360083 [Vibrio coralliirubri]
MLEKIPDINKMYHQEKIHDYKIDISSLYLDTKKPALLAGFSLVR